MRGLMKGGPAKAASTFVVTLFLVLAVMACQGPVGPAGTDGAKGDPGTGGGTPTVDPINPTEHGSIENISLQVGWSDTVDVKDNFKEPQGQPLAYSATTNNSSIAVMRAGGSVIKVTGVTVGTATVTVTATDTEGGTAKQTFKVTVTAAMALMAEGTIEDQPLYEGDSVTVDVRSAFNIHDERMTYRAESANDLLATASADDSEVTITAVRTTGSGGVFITVTATDPGGKTAQQLILVVVMPAADKPTDPDPEDTDDSADTCALRLDGEEGDNECIWLLAAGERLRSTDTAGATVAPDTDAEGNVWTVTAVRKGDTRIEILQGRTVVHSFVVTVANQRPVRTDTEPPQSLVMTPIPATGEEGKPYYRVTFSDGDFFEDKDGDTLTYRVSSSNPDVLIRKDSIESDGGTIMSVDVDVLANNNANFSLRLYVEDNDDEKARSDMVMVGVKPMEPRSWEYDVTQLSDGSFTRALKVGRREGVTHTLAFAAAEAAEDGAEPEGNYPLVFFDLISGTTAPGAIRHMKGADPAGDTDTLLVVSKMSGPIEFVLDETTELAFVAAADGATGTIDFMVTGRGSATIRFQYFTAEEVPDSEPAAFRWTSAAREDLIFTVTDDIKDDADFSFR